MIDDDLYGTRSALTFAQAEGTEAVPSQLKRTEISRQLASQIWAIIHDQIQATIKVNALGQSEISGCWAQILRDHYVLRLNRPVDEFFYGAHGPSGAFSRVKRILYSERYIDFYDFLQFVLRHPHCPSDLPLNVSYCLDRAHAGYRLVNGDTFIPLTTEHEARIVELALNDVSASGIGGAHSHLRNAADAVTKGSYTDCIRESIHAVESVARTLAPSGSLGDALAILEKSIAIHGGLKSGFKSIYGYTSDEKGIRRPLLEKDAASVDETDALFIFSACAAFISFLMVVSRLVV